MVPHTIRAPFLHSFLHHIGRQETGWVGVQALHVSVPKGWSQDCGIIEPGGDEGRGRWMQWCV